MKKILIFFALIILTISAYCQWNGTSPVWTNSSVGIGTSAPAYMFTIKGPYAYPQALIGNDGSNGIFFHSQGTSTHYNWLIGQQRTVDGGLEFTPSTSTGGTIFSNPVIVFKATGNVGIGVISPTTIIEAGGTISSQKVAENAVYFNGYINSSYPNRVTLGIASWSGYLSLWNSASTKTIHLNSGGDSYFNGGNVGIGTASPDALLTMFDGGSNYLLNVGGSGNGKIKVRHIDGKHWQSTDVSDLFLQYGVNYNTFINAGGSSGGVGIGTTDLAGYKLNVSGKIRANEVVVNTTGADFVFDRGYNLMKLSDVEKFIKENNRLPKVPSAMEMQTTGMSISETQTLLLQKIEELTLYIIDQQKEIENLKILVIQKNK